MQFSEFCDEAVRKELSGLVSELQRLVVDKWPGIFHEGKRARCFKVNGNDGSYFLKYLYPGRLFSINEARHSFNMSLRLVRKGICTPTPYCWIRLDNAQHRGVSLFITDFLDGAERLGAFIDRHLRNRSSSDLPYLRRRIFFTSLGRFVATLHNNGVYHGDFNVNNILVRKNGEGYAFYLIDTGDIRAVPWISHRRVIKNLDEVNRFFLDTRCVSRSDRLRFLKKYLTQRKKRSNTRSPECRKYWKEVCSRTQKRLKIHHKEFVTSG